MLTTINAFEECAPSSPSVWMIASSSLLSLLQLWLFRTDVNTFALIYYQMTTCISKSWPYESGAGMYQTLTGIRGRAGWAQSGSCRGWLTSSRAPSHTWSAGWAELRSEPRSGTEIHRCSETPGRDRRQNYLTATRQTVASTMPLVGSDSHKGCVYLHVLADCIYRSVYLPLKLLSKQASWPTWPWWR